MAADPASALPDDAVEVARIIGAWGLRGGLKLKPYASDPQALFASKRWFLQPPEVARPAGVASALAAFPGLLRVISAREQNDVVVATVHDVADRDQAESLKGARVFVSRASFPTADADEFYWVDLIGLEVVSRQGAVLGAVAGLIETGPHCVLRVVEPTEGTERLVPFVAAYVDGVDTVARRITVDWDASYDDNG